MVKKEKKIKTKEIKKVKASGKGVKTADMSVTAAIIEEPDLNELGKEVSPTSAKVSTGKAESKKAAKQRGKAYLTNKKTVEGKTLPPKEAFELLKKVSYSKFPGTVEVHLNLFDKGLSGDVKLPHFEGKAQKVVIFNEEIAAEIKAGKVNFDVLLATPADMPKITPLAKVLGPKGLMPNPKNGTLVPDPKKALENFSSSGVHFKTEKDFPLIHIAIGKVNQPTEELVANLEALVKAVNPKNIKKTVIKSTMSPGIKISL